MAPVIQKVYNATHRINLYPVDSAIDFPIRIHWVVIYPVDSTIQLLNTRRLPTVPQCLFIITLELDDSQTLYVLHIPLVLLKELLKLTNL